MSHLPCTVLSIGAGLQPQLLQPSLVGLALQRRKCLFQACPRTVCTSELAASSQDVSCQKPPWLEFEISSVLKIPAPAEGGLATQGEGSSQGRRKPIFTLALCTVHSWMSLQRAEPGREGSDRQALGVLHAEWRSSKVDGAAHPPRGQKGHQACEATAVPSSLARSRLLLGSCCLPVG